MVDRTQLVFWVPFLGILILAIVLYIPEFIGGSLWLNYTDRMNLILTVALTMFAAIEGYSSYIQAESQNNRNLIEDARNELEKVYGPLYSLLNSNTDEILKVVNLLDDDKKYLDSLFSAYPFMFTTEIYDTWQKKIQNIECKGTTSKIVGATGSQRELKFARYYYIPLEFKKMIDLEYDHKVRRYDKLLKK